MIYCAKKISETHRTPGGVKFLVDAQLSCRIALRLREAGNDAIHTLDLPKGNLTSDVEILAVASREQRVVITKNADFVNSFRGDGVDGETDVGRDRRRDRCSSMDFFLR
jgi:hypothetical protein